MCLRDVKVPATGGCMVGGILDQVAGSDIKSTHSLPLTVICFRQVNVDHQHVGWYQSSQFGNFLSSQLLESQFSYQTSIEESVCLVFDTAKTSQGFLSVKAYRSGN